MTLCRWFNILDPAELKRRVDMTPRLYKKWLQYYDQTGGHPSSLLMTLGVSTYNMRMLANKRNVAGIKPQDLVAGLPREKVDATDAEALEQAMLGVM